MLVGPQKMLEAYIELVLAQGRTGRRQAIPNIFKPMVFRIIHNLDLPNPREFANRDGVSFPYPIQHCTELAWLCGGSRIGLLKSLKGRAVNIEGRVGRHLSNSVPWAKRLDFPLVGFQLRR